MYILGLNFCLFKIVFEFNRTSIYRTREGRGRSVSPRPPVQLRTVEVRNPNYSSLKKGIYRRLILFCLNTWKIFRFHDFMGDFRLSEKVQTLRIWTCYISF